MFFQQQQSASASFQGRTKSPSLRPSSAANPCLQSWCVCLLHCWAGTGCLPGLSFHSEAEMSTEGWRREVKLEPWCSSFQMQVCTLGRQAGIGREGERGTETNIHPAQNSSLFTSCMFVSFLPWEARWSLLTPSIPPFQSPFLCTLSLLQLHI